MREPQLRRYLTVLRPVAREAGARILEIASALGPVETKPDGSPVTRADRAANKIIVNALKKLTPEVPIVSEEGTSCIVHGASCMVQGERCTTHEALCTLFWLVDPLDGTKEFVAGVPDYTVNIALIERAEPILGLIQVPATDELYFAARALGAFKASGSGRARRIHVRENTGEQVAVISRSNSNPETEALLGRLGATRVIRRGSSLKFCAVAEGTADLYPRVGPTHLWDTAAGCAIARAAGCRVTGLDGKDLRYDLEIDLHEGFIVQRA